MWKCSGLMGRVWNGFLILGREHAWWSNTIWESQCAMEGLSQIRKSRKMGMKSMGSLSECDGKTRLMAQSVKDLPQDYDDLHSIPRTCVKKWSLMACRCVSALESQEAGRQTDRSLGPLSASPGHLVKFQADKRVCVKQKMKDPWRMIPEVVSWCL